MIVKAFAMRVFPDCHEEYRKRHSPIWPELEATLKEHGVRRYSIFLHEETSQLFAYAEVEDEERWQAIAETAVCRRWWKYMRDIMPANADHSPVAVDLKRVFNLS
jgi:L-rhamnose mutarotase